MRIVVPVRRVPVPHEIARELDLVGRVVHVEPGVRRLAQADLEQHRRDEQQDDDREREPEGHAPPPGSRAPADDRGGGHQHARKHRDRSDHAHVPAPVSRADERPENAVGMHGSRVEGPCLRAQLRHVQRDERPERAEQDPGSASLEPRRFLALHFVTAKARRRPSVAADSAASAGCAARKLAPTPRTNHVIGSSKKPL